MNIVRTVLVTDPLARANVVAVLSGDGAPVGVTACELGGESVVISFDSKRTSIELIDALIAVATRFVPVGCTSGGLENAAAIAARGLVEPDLEPARILEMYFT